MSESAPESGGHSGNVFLRKLGPLPMWTWMAIILLLGLMFYVVKGQNAKSASATAGGTPTSQAAGGVDSSLVPQFVNQVYGASSPPPAPSLPNQNSTTTIAGPTNHLSWTDTGQKWNANTLAKQLGIGITGLVPSNSAAKKALADPTKPMPKGAKFTYVKGGKPETTITTTYGSATPGVQSTGSGSSSSPTSGPMLPQ